MSHLKYMFYFIQMCEMSWRNALISISDWSKMMSVCMTHSTLRGGGHTQGIWNKCGWSCSLTDCLHDVGEEAEGHNGFRKLSKEKFQSSCDDVNVLPITLVQIQLLLWEMNGGGEGGRGWGERGEIHTDGSGEVNKRRGNMKRSDKEWELGEKHWI